MPTEYNFFVGELYKHYSGQGKQLSVNVIRILSKPVSELSEEEKETYESVILQTKPMIKEALIKRLNSPGAKKEEWQDQLLTSPQSIIRDIAAEALLESDSLAKSEEKGYVAAAKYCQACGSKVTAADRFCKKCGTVIHAAEVPKEKVPLVPENIAKITAAICSVGLGMFALGLGLSVAWSAIMSAIIAAPGYPVWSGMTGGKLSFYTNQLIPLRMQMGPTNSSSMYHTQPYSITIMTIVFLIIFYFGGRVAVRFCRPKKTWSAALYGSMICIPYTIALLIFLPFARDTQSDMFVNWPATGYVLLYGIVWPAIFGAMGGVREYKGKRALRSITESWGLKIPYYGEKLVRSFWVAVNVLVVCIIIGLIAYIALSINYVSGNKFAMFDLEVVFPDGDFRENLRMDLRDIINDAPSYLFHVYGWSLGVPQYYSSEIWIEGDAPESSEQQFNVYGGFDEKSIAKDEFLEDSLNPYVATTLRFRKIEKTSLSWLFLILPFVVFIYGGVLLAKRQEMYDLKSYLVSLISYALFFSILSIILGEFTSWDNPYFIGNFSKGLSLGFLFVLSFGWALIVSGITAAIIYRHERLHG